MKKHLNILPFILILTLLVTVFPINAGDYAGTLNLEYDGRIMPYTQRLVDVHINDQEIKTGDMPAVIIDSRTLVPVREVFESEAVGATVQWVDDTREVHIWYKDQYVVLQIDSNIAKVNGEEKTLDVPAKLVRDISKSYSKTMIPLRFAAEQLGYNVDWDEENYIANLYSSDYVASDSSKNSDTDSNTSEESNIETEVTDDHSLESGETPLVGGHTPNGSQADSGDLLVTSSLEYLDTQNWILSQSMENSLPTGLSSKAVSLVASGDARKPLDENSILTDIVGIESDSVEIYNLLFHYDEGTPEKITFEVAADDPISDIITSLEGDILELYILKATIDMNTTSFEYDNHPMVDAIDIIEYTGSETGNRNCVIKFDLSSEGMIFNIRMNELRQKIYIDVINNHIEGVTVGQNDVGDYIDIQGVATDQVDVYRPDINTLSFDILNTNTLIEDVIKDLKGEFINTLEISKKDSTTSNITLNMSDGPQYKISMPNEDTTRIQLIKPEYKGVDFSTGEESRISFDSSVITADIIEEITGVDDYLNKEYSITLPGDLIGQIGTDIIEVNSIGVDEIAFASTNDGNTSMTIRTNKIQGVLVTSFENQLVFEVKDPQEIYDGVIVIDPGHGGWKPGANSKGYYEKDINLQVALKLKELLDSDENIKAYFTRVDDSHVELSDRADMANKLNADFFLSLHSNSYWADKHGAVSLYMDRETNRNLSNYNFARTIQDNYVAGTSFIDKVITERDNLYVLKYTEMTAMLLEMGYMSNTSDLVLLIDDEHQYKMAKSIYEGIVEGFSKLAK